MLAFGDLDEVKAKKAEIGAIVKETLEGNGFRVQWSGNPETRINIPEFEWKRRRSR